MFAFRRATHTRDGEERTELRGKHQDVWEAAGLTCHHMSTAKAMTLAEVHAEIVSDETNYMVGGSMGELDDRSPVPTVEEVARDIVLLLQCGLVEVMPAGWTREAMLERRSKSKLSPDLRAEVEQVRREERARQAVGADLDRRERLWGQPYTPDERRRAVEAVAAPDSRDIVVAAGRAIDIDEAIATYRKQMIRIAALAVAAVESFDRKQDRAFPPGPTEREQSGGEVGS